jgi:hypothetical protein
MNIVRVSLAYQNYDIAFLAQGFDLTREPWRVLSDSIRIIENYVNKYSKYTRKR